MAWRPVSLLLTAALCLSAPASAEEAAPARVETTAPAKAETPASNAETPAAKTTEREGRPGQPSVEDVVPGRFGMVPDAAYGAFQRGLYITALKLALAKAKEGDAAAQTLAAVIYSRGLGVPRDEEEAAKWYGKAAAQGDPHAEFQYALMLIDGTVVPKNLDRAYKLMKDAADHGNHLAEFNLAQMMLDRNAGGVEEAVVYYERAAEAGVADAQYAMAEVYANGAAGKPKDDEKARMWLERAARKNYDTAQLELGTWLVQGRGGEADPQAGFGWLERAAQGGNVAAQNRLAKLYVAGIGTEPDAIAAAAWYVLAHRAGLVDPEMEDFMNGLTDEQREEAIERANRLR